LVIVKKMGEDWRREEERWRERERGEEVVVNMWAHVGYMLSQLPHRTKLGIKPSKDLE
jgi:hypothetical protein